jgi:peptidylprolyl isomerase
MIQNGSTVDVHYTGRLNNGEVFDSSEGRETLSFTMGSGNIIPGFENALVGRTIGDKVTVNIKPDEAYGEYKQELVVKVPMSQMPGSVQVGQKLQAQSDNGSPIMVTVAEVNDDHVLIDGNHPLSGKELIFDIEVVDVK